MRARMITWAASLSLAACASTVTPPDSADDASVEASVEASVDASAEAEAGVPRAFASRVVSFMPGSPGDTFGSNRLPDIVLGPPQGGGEFYGSTDVVSLGAGGTICLEFAEDVVDGPGVAVAVELADRAAPGQLLVSSTVRDLVAASGIALVPAGDDAYRLPISRP